MAEPDFPDWLRGDGEMSRRVRAHDWSATALGPPERWPAALRTTLNLILGHPLPMVLAWGPDFVTLYNDAYRPLLGEKREALGRSFLEVWEEARDVAAPQLARAFAGEACRFDNARFVLQRGSGPEEAFFDYSCSPVYDETGAVAGVLVTAIEVSALRASKERQAFLLALGDAMRAQQDAHAMIEIAARLLGERLGASRIMFAEFDEARGIADIFHGWFADGAEPFPALMQLTEFEGPVLDSLRAERIVRVDDAGDPSLRRADLAAIAELGVKALLSVPLLASRKLLVNLSVHQHVPRRWTDEEVALVQEVAERLWADVVRARAQAALRESEERLRRAVEVGKAGLWEWDMRSGATYWSDGHYLMQGYAIGEVTPGLQPWLARVHPDDRAEVEAALARAGETRQEYVGEYRTLFPDGAVRWRAARGRFFYDDADQPVRMVGAAIDITERRAFAERQEALLAELQHRVRNILAVIRSMVRRSHEEGQTAEEFIQHLEGRLDALARTQVLLTRGVDVGVDFELLLRDELEAQAAEPGRIRLSGPDVMLAPKAAEVLTLAVHELATNAVKYGALSAPSGHLDVVWREERRGDERWLVIRWEESGVRLVRSAPRRQGFGTELITGRVPYELGGRGTLDLRPGGIVCALELPLRDRPSILQTDGGGPA